jgi:hypothetical protein
MTNKGKGTPPRGASYMQKKINHYKKINPKWRSINYDKL